MMVSIQLIFNFLWLFPRATELEFYGIFGIMY
jgi:hypothetical protein